MTIKIRILLADRHRLLQDGMRLILSETPDLILLESCCHGRNLLSLCLQHQPHVLLLAVDFLNEPLEQMFSCLTIQAPKTNVLLLAAETDEIGTHTLLQTGVVGCVLKSETSRTLIQAIRTVAAGDTWFSQALISDLIALSGSRTTWKQQDLTILQALVDGQTIQAIAFILDRSERTVYNRLQIIRQKFNVQSRAEIVREAIKQRLVSC